MKITLICVAKKPPEWLNRLVQDYLKRMPKYFHINEILIPHSDLKQEAERIFSHLKMNDTHKRMIALSSEGENIDSIQFANKLNRWQNEANHLYFLIGGANGLDSELKEKSDWLWSFSKLTFPHKIIQLIFYEQLYRACSILQKKPYHLGH